MLFTSFSFNMIGYILLACSIWGNLINWIMISTCQIKKSLFAMNSYQMRVSCQECYSRFHITTVEFSRYHLEGDIKRKKFIAHAGMPSNCREQCQYTYIAHGLFSLSLFLNRMILSSQSIHWCVCDWWNCSNGSLHRLRFSVASLIDGLKSVLPFKYRWLKLNIAQ